MSNENENIGRSGERFHISWVNRLTQVGDQSELLSIGTDVSDRKRAEDCLSKKLKQETLLNQITYQIRQSLDIQEIFKVAVEEIARVFQVSRCYLKIYQEEPTPNFPQQAEHRDCDYANCDTHILWVPEHPYIQKLLERDSALATDNLQEDDLLQALVPVDTQLKSILSIRTSYQEKANGILSLQQCDRPRHWTEDDINLLESVASRIGIAILEAQSPCPSQTTPSGTRSACRAAEDANQPKANFSPT